MPFKSRTESAELLSLRYLNNRMNLLEPDKQHYFNLRKGYDGEVMFDSFTQKLQCECFILNDLLLKMNNTIFQIDSLIITSETIYHFEVKNYEGDYYYESDKLFKKPKSEMINPLHQLGRSEALLRQLLNTLGFNMPIEAAVIFINPEFTLYQAPLNKPFIFPSQINRFFEKLNMTPSKLNEKHKMLADKLTSLHIEDAPFKQLPSYDYDQLRKGITCAECNSFSVTTRGKHCVCTACGHTKSVETAVLQSIKELKLLFPNQKITTNVIHDWCKVVKTKKKIRKILEKHSRMVGVHQWSFYE